MGNNRKPTARFQEGSGASLGAPELVRLSKRMSELGLASRREAACLSSEHFSCMMNGAMRQKQL